MAGDARTHAIQRSIAKLAIGVAQDVTKRTQEKAPHLIAERAEDFQIKASGLAADFPVWQFGQITFDNRYTQATGRRNSDLTRPQIATGFEQISGVGLTDARLVPVIATLVVTDWTIGEADTIDGCTFACSAIAPGDQVQFQGFFHMTLNGFGAPDDATTTNGAD